MGAKHYLTRDFNMIVKGKKYSFTKGMVYDVPDEVANQHYFQMSEDKEKARGPERPQKVSLSHPKAPKPESKPKQPAVSVKTERKDSITT